MFECIKICLQNTINITLYIGTPAYFNVKLQNSVFNNNLYFKQVTKLHVFCYTPFFFIQELLFYD